MRDSASRVEPVNIPRGFFFGGIAIIVLNCGL